MLSAVATLIQPTVDSQLVPVHARVQRMELFVYDQAKLALPESCRPLHCGLLRLSGGGATGWAEFEFSDGSAHLDLIKWGQVFRRLKHVEAAEARILIHQYESQWGFTRTHLAAEALTAWHKALSEGVSGAESGIEASSYMTGWTGLATEREFLSYYCQSYYSF